MGFACLGEHPGASSDQQKPDQPVFRSAVDVAVIDVTVVDDAGKPVRGLTAADFVVKVTGHPRRIQALDYLEFGRTDVVPGGPLPAASSNTPEPSATRGLSRGGRIIVVVVDDLSSKPVANAGLLAAAERILATLDPTDLVGLITTSGYGPFVAPTSNREEFRGALRNKTIVGQNDSYSYPFFITTKEAVDSDNRALRQDDWISRECPPPPENQQPNCSDRAKSTARRLGVEARHRRDQQMGAFANIIEGLKAMPRPRVLIVLGQGLALDGHSDRREEIDRLGRLAADADVRFYSVTETADDAGVTMQGSASKCTPPCVDYYRAQRNETSFLLGGMQILAAATGGEAFRNIGQADRFLDRVVTETSGLYRLGVEVPAGVAEKYPTLEVSTTRRGLTVRATRHLAPERGEKVVVPVEELLRQRIALGGHSFGIPVTVAALLRGDPAAPSHDAAISVRVPASVSAPLSVRFALVDDRGKVAAQGTKPIAAHTAGEDHEVTMLVQVTANAQGYRLRVAVADGDGRIGSVESRVRNTVTPAGQAQVSQVFLNWSTSVGRNFLAFDVAPHTATALSCTMDVYPGPIAPADIRVAFAISRDGETTPVVAREITPRAGAGLTATITVPIAQLPPGAYSVTGTVMAGARSLGSQSASFSIPRPVAKID